VLIESSQRQLQAGEGRGVAYACCPHHPSLHIGSFFTIHHCILGHSSPSIIAYWVIPHHPSLHIGSFLTIHHCILGHSSPSIIAYRVIPHHPIIAYRVIPHHPSLHIGSFLTIHHCISGHSSPSIIASGHALLASLSILASCLVSLVASCRAPSSCTLIFILAVRFRASLHAVLSLYAITQPLPSLLDFVVQGSALRVSHHRTLG
jgi:hypothetical protein